MTRVRRLYSIKNELLAKSREAALSAVQVFNNPLIKFKSETFIVLMIIAWTYLLHAYYRSKKIEYRYFDKNSNRRRFLRTKNGAYKYWELEHCLNNESCPIDRNTSINLRFLIGLRHEVEHQMTLNLDNYLSGRYQACCLNYNEHVKKLFGNDNSIDKYLTYSLQFVELSTDQIERIPTEDNVPDRLKNYITEFDGKLAHEEFNSPQYSYRLLFKRKLVGRAGQADKVIEFIDPNSERAKQVDKEYWVQKEVERKKYLPGQIVKLMKEEGFSKFNMHHHTQLWKEIDAKNPGKGYGIQVISTWYWYERWIEEVRNYCNTNRERYQEVET